MKRTGKVTAVMALVAVLGSAVPVFAEQPPILLTLKDAIKLAFERNLDLKVELYNPAIAEADIRRSLGIYDPLFSASINYNRNSSPNTVTFSPLRVDQFTATAGVTQLLPTGGTVGASGQSEHTSSDQLGFFTNGPQLTFSQPLLKNLGREQTDLVINVARYNKRGAIDRFETRLSDVVAQVRNDYFRLYNLRELLKVRRTTLTLAQRILAETKGRVQAGVLPAMEILSAEFGVATREKDVIDAERAVQDQMDVLRLELQLDPSREIMVVDEPTRENYAVNPETELALALKNRPEIAAQKVAVGINDLQQKVARNRTLPDLNLTANLGTIGFDNSLTHSFSKSLHVDDPVWGIGLQFSYPIGNRAAENDYIRSKLTLEQSQTQLQNLQSGIAKDVNTSIRLLGSSYKQIEVTTRGRAYAEERLRSFQKKNAVGLATTKDVIDVLNDLVTAEGNQIQAVVDYNNAITQLWRVTGEILDRQGIRITDKQGDPLYEQAR
jgi:outer membrane protein